MVQINGDLVVYYGIMLLGACLGYTQAKLCAWASRDGLQAFILYALIASFEIILCGFIIMSKDIPSYLRWTSWIMFTRWACSSLVYNEFNGFKTDGDPREGIIDDQGELVLEYWHLSSFDDFRAIAILIGYWIVMEVFVIIALQPAKSNLETVCGSNHTLLGNLLEDENEEKPSESMQSFSFETSTVGKMDESLKSDLLHASKRQSLALSISTESTIFPLLNRATVVEPYNRIRPSVLANSVCSLSRMTYTENDFFKASESLPVSARAELSFLNISYTLTPRNAPPVKLLKGISGILRSGEMLAVMGTR